MAKLKDVVDRLKAEGQLDRNTGTNSMKVQIGILKEIHASLHVTGMAVKEIAAKINGQATQDKQRAVQQGFQAQENTEKQIENNNKNTSALRKGLDGVKTAVSGTFGFLKDALKTGLLGAALPLLFGALGGPAAMAIGALTGNPFLILIGAIGTLTEMLAAGDLMEILRDPDKSIGEKLAAIFYEGENSLLGRIKKQAEDLYERIIPEEDRERIRQTMDEFREAVRDFKETMDKIKKFLGFGDEEDGRISVLDAMERSVGRDLPSRVGARLSVFSKDDNMTYGEARRFLSDIGATQILSNLPEGENNEPMPDRLYAGMIAGLQELYPDGIPESIPQVLQRPPMDSPILDRNYQRVAPVVRPFRDLQDRIQEVNAQNQQLPSVFNQTTDNSQSTTVFSGQNPSPVDRFTGQLGFAAALYSGNFAALQGLTE